MVQSINELLYAILCTKCDKREFVAKKSNNACSCNNFDEQRGI